MSHLIFVRHGESQLNVENRKQQIFCGQTDTPLTEVGRQQASATGRELAGRGEMRIQRAISSALSRSIETLDLILQELSNGVEHLPHSPALNERSLGVFEGRVAKEVYAEYPEYENDPNFNQFRYDFMQKAPGGENLKEVTTRAWSVVQSLEAECEGDILVVSHYTTIRCILGEAMRWPVQTVLDTKVANAVPVILERGETYQLLEGVTRPE